MLKLNSKSTITLAYAGSLLSLAALLIFKFLPTSELANGIQYSGTDALWALALCPLLAVLGAVCFMGSFLKDYKQWQDMFSKTNFSAATVACGIIFVINIVVYLSLFIKYFRLGFVAPYTNSSYELYEIFVIIMTIHQFILSTFAAIAVKRNNK